MRDKIIDYIVDNFHETAIVDGLMQPIDKEDYRVEVESNIDNLLQEKFLLNTPENQEILKKWVEALRSGKYKQGGGYMYEPIDNTYCCVGVLYVVAGCPIQKISDAHVPNSSIIGEVPFFQAMHKTVDTTFYQMNDYLGLSFNQIADVIEKFMIITNND